MVTRNNRRNRPGRTGFAVANLLDTMAGIGARYIGAQERARVDALRAENMKLRNQLAHAQQGVISNRVVEGDLKIELLQLKIREMKAKLRITDTPFVGDGYTDPGNIREENRRS